MTRRRTGHLLDAVVRGGGKPGSPITFVAVTEGRKADGLDLRMSAARLDRYRANPVVLYGHQAHGRNNLPIGRAADVYVDGPRLLVDVTFDQSDPFAAEVERKVRAKILNAVSAGFEVGTVDSQGRPDSWDLLEVSVVPIPLDADAVVASGRSLVTLARARESGLPGRDVDALAGMFQAFDRLDATLAPRQKTLDEMVAAQLLSLLDTAAQ